jgi:hypothetical protein
MDNGSKQVSLIERRSSNIRTKRDFRVVAATSAHSRMAPTPYLSLKDR